MLCNRCFCSAHNYHIIRLPVINNGNNFLFKTKPFSFSRKLNFTPSLCLSHSHPMELDNSSSSNKNQEPSRSFDFLSQKAYTPPSWASHLTPIPSHFFSLGHLPTPIHKWNLPNLPTNTEVYLKVIKSKKKNQIAFLV